MCIRDGLAVGHDLHDAAVHVVLAGGVPGNQVQIQGGIAVFIPSGRVDARCRRWHHSAQLKRQGEGHGNGCRPSCFSHAVSSCDFVLERERYVLPI